MSRIIRFGAALVTLGLGAAYLQFLEQKQKALARLHGGSRITQTSLGALEYAVAGQGQPILIMHGSGGGYEQGLLFNRVCDPLHFQTIAVSRPGYFRTPLSTGRTPELQADGCAALLDELDIKDAVVLGISAGGLSAIQFALRHPDRCRALVLLSAVTPAIQDMHAPQWMLSMLRFMMASDFVIWLMLKLSNKSLVGAMTGKLSLDPHVDGEGLAIVNAIIQGLFPASLWRDGTINDIQQVDYLDPASVQHINVPTLIIHGTHDRLVPYRVAQNAADTIPDAKLVTIEGGSHLIVGTHRIHVGEAIESFVSRQSLGS